MSAPTAVAPATRRVVRGRAQRRVPAIDGIRGFALLGMLAWHARIPWVQGGFARMTVFFVLAGYLAASSQLRIAERSARPFAGFWARRARRLVPITLLGVLIAVGATALVGGPVARGQALGDATSVIFSFSNWRFILAGREYGAMFEQASAFQHFWSLSVEEQCFLALPLLLAAIGLATRRSQRRSAEQHRAAEQRPSAEQGGTRRLQLTVALAVALAATPLVITMSADAAYYSTIVRGGEFLAGVALAMWWQGQRSKGTSSSTVARWDVAGLAGFGILLLVMATMDRETTWLYRGGMGVFAIPAVALLGGVVVGGPWVNRVLGWRPLAALGRWAFPIYVLHWPLFLVMDDRFPTVPRGLLVAAELALAVALGAAVHRWIERPLMPGTGALSDAINGMFWSRPRRVVIAGVLGVTVCLLAAAAIPEATDSIDFAAAEAESGTDLSLDEARALVDSADDASLLDSGAVDAILNDTDTALPGLPVFRDPERVGVALFGGSTALTIALGGEALAEFDEGYEAIPGYSPLGCGILDEGVRGDREDPPDPEPPNPVPATCEERNLRWAATAIAHQVDVAVVGASMMDVLDWQLPGDDEWRALGDPAFDDYLADQLRSTADAFRAQGVDEVIWLTPIPPPERLGERRMAERAERQSRYSQIVAQVAEETNTTVVDLGAWAQSLPVEERRTLTPDGVHPDLQGARRIWSELLGPSILGLTSA